MIGSLVGIKYEILSELDSTPLFSSFRAVDRSNGRDVRIRILESTLSGERRFVDSLNEHVDSLRAINHPALEKIYDVVDENEQYSLICEYVQANNLELRVKRLASFSVQLAISTAISICDGLSAVHQAGVVHGDISGQNILVTPSGAVKLTMTGLWNAYPSSSKAGLVMLKNMAPYMAPEVTSGSMPNNLSD
ncbi:MAG: protein kinase, partial [Chthonomonadaceae bacterium]|nr:protein kinase [Chthonomonadaceae bacterium]